MNISKRAKTVETKYRNVSKSTFRYIDSTALKVFVEFEWKVKNHVCEKRRTWHKLHLAVDTHEIISAKVSFGNIGDGKLLPTLLNSLHRKISEVSLMARKQVTKCLSKNDQTTYPTSKNASEIGHSMN